MVPRGVKGGTATLKRKIRRMRNSLAVALPSQLAELADFEAGDVVVFDFLGKGYLKISKED